MVAAPDVAPFPAFMPPAMSPEASGGLDRLTTWLLVVGGIPKRAGNAARLARVRGGVGIPMQIRLVIPMLAAR
jgi:hypothetical protein